MLALVGSFPTHLRHYFPIGKPTKKNKHNDVLGIGLFGFPIGSPLTLAKGIRGDPIGTAFVF